ncbi:MAG: TrkA family potassium uptake protein [Solobacterium sp.]|nr:TrkA family potassium uptake protein [Solobacterium sp.]
MANKENMTYAVIGLGNFGIAVAETMASAGQDVIAIDKSPIAVQSVADTVSNAVCADSMDIELLKEAGVQDADVAIVSMGSHLEACVTTILNLQELGIRNIIAKANNERYKYVLERIGADTVIQPEYEMGQRLAISLVNPKIIDIYQINNDYTIMEIKAPELWWNRAVETLNLREIYGVNIIGIRIGGGEKVETNIKKDYVIRQDDYLVIAADTARIAALNLD